MPKVESFQIRVKEGKVLLRVIPLAGEKTNCDVIQDELHALDVDYLPERLLEICGKASNKFEELSDAQTTKFQLQVEITDNEQTAYLTIIPPSVKEDTLDLNRITKELNEAGVHQGILNDAILTMIEQKIENEPTVVARGKLPIDGHDGYPELLFMRETTDQSDALNVDIREMNLLQSVQEGEILVRIVPPSSGIDGYTVTGKVLNAESGKKYRIRLGKNTLYNADRTQIIASKSGHVTMKGNNITVSNVHVVDNVNSNTGHVRFDGILKIRGDIQDGYNAEATIRIDVGGSIGKSRVRTGGDLRVGQGINGSMIKAGESVRAAFISDAKVDAGSHIVVDDYILNSRVSAGETVNILQPKGFASGGEIYAGNIIKVPTAGSEKTGAHTLLEVGIPINTRKAFRKVEDNIELNLSNYEKLKKNVLILQKAREQRGSLPEDHENIFKNIVGAMRTTGGAIIKDMIKWRKLVETNRNNHHIDGGVVFVAKTVYPGTDINIRRTVFKVSTPYSNAAFVFQQNGIEVKAFDKVFSRYKRYFLHIRA